MSILRYLGLGEEAEFGTAVGADFHVDIASASLDAPNETQIIYTGGLGRSAYMHRPGFYAPTGNIVYAFDVRTIAFLLKWALGGYSFVAGTHTIWGSPASVLPSFTARVGKDHFEHVFAGCVLNSLQIQVEGEYCVATADIVSSKDSKEVLKDIEDLLLPDEYPMVFHEVTASLAGVNRSADIKSLTININNNISADGGRRIGNRHPQLLSANEREVSVSMNMFYGDTAELEKYWGGATGPDPGGSEEFAVNINFDSGDYGLMVVTLPRFIYTQVNQQPSGRDEITQATAGRALLGHHLDIDTDITAVVQNGEGEI